ncbi:MAG TPA: hypothetical protein VII06_09430 [Chloroflexota bacterium]
MAPAHDDDGLTYFEAARLLGSSVATVERLHQRGILPHAPGPYHRVLDAAAVRRLARERRIVTCAGVVRPREALHDD